MNDAQIWATILGTVVLAWHGINVLARLRVARSMLELKGQNSAEPSVDLEQPLSDTEADLDVEGPRERRLYEKARRA